KRYTAADFTTSYDVTHHFSEAIYNHLGVFITPIADGEIHRIDDPNGRPGNLACWYACRMDGVPSCTFGNWRTGERYAVSATRGCRSPVPTRNQKNEAMSASNRRKAE